MDPDPLKTNLRNLGEGARNLASAAVGAERVDRSLARASKFGATLRSTFGQLLSPLGIAAGLALGFAGTIYKAVMNSRLMQAALERAAQVQLYTPQFAKILGSLDKAKQRLQEIARISAAGPFKFDDLVEAERRLINLTNGRIANPAGRQMTQDLAAVTQIAPSEAADLLGGLNADIALERSIEGTVRQLRALGGISEDAKNQIIALEQAGVRGAALWNAVTAALARNRGGAEALRNTLSGLSAELDNAKGQQLGEIGAMFEEAKMQGLRLAIQLVKEWGPVLKELLLPVAQVANFIAKLLTQINALVRAIPGVKEGFLLVARAAGLFFAALVAIGAVQLGRFLLLLVPLFGKLALSISRAAVAGGVFSKVLGFGLIGILKILGPVLALVAALNALSNNATVRFLFPGLDEEKRKMEELQEQLASLTSEVPADSAAPQGGIQQKVNQLERTEQALRTAQAARRAAEEKRIKAAEAGEASRAQAADPNDPEAIRRAGGRFGELNDAIRWLLGFDPSAVAEEAAIAEAAAAQEAVEKAEALKKAAREAAVKTPAEYLNDPDFEAARAEAEALLARADAMQDELEAQGSLSGEQRAGRQQAIDDLRQEAVARMDPERIEKDFNRRLARGETQSRLLRTMSEVTGDESMRVRANELEDNNRTQQRGRQMAKDLGIPLAEALDMARGEVLTDRLNSERARGDNMMFASGLGRVGGAGAEAGGGSSEEARLLQQIVRLMEKPVPAGLPADMMEGQR
jgi:hypothetical protein